MVLIEFKSALEAKVQNVIFNLDSINLLSLGATWKKCHVECLYLLNQTKMFALN